MHSFFIAACFVLIVLAPCVAAQGDWAQTTPAKRKPKPQSDARLQRKKEQRRKLAEEIALDELEDPNSYADMRRRAVLLKCVRVSQFKEMHLATDGGLAASHKSRAA